MTPSYRQSQIAKPRQVYRVVPPSRGQLIDRSIIFQWASFYFAIAQLGIEALGLLITFFALRQKREQLSAQALEQRFTAQNSSVNTGLDLATPNFDVKF
jgi:hypothetical protein